MEGKVVILAVFVICASMSSLVSPLNLPALSTQKPNRHPPRLVTSAPSDSYEKNGVTPPASAALATAAPEAKKDSVLYRLKEPKSDKTCILMNTDGIVEVIYKLHGLEEPASSLFPDDAIVDGNCNAGGTAELRLSWKGFIVIFKFDKTMGGEMWYVSKVELIANVNLDKLHGIDTPYHTIKLYHKDMIMLTPVGKSYVCPEVNIQLETDPEDNPPEGLRGSILLRLVKVQPFMYKAEDFGEAFQCKDASQFRDETAPIAVGSTLALVALGTVTGYGMYKYFKVKNVQYNTME